MATAPSTSSKTDTAKSNDGGNLDTTKEQPWFYMGAFIVDDSQDGPTTVRLNVPDVGGEGESKQTLLADRIAACLEKRTGRFESLNNLKAMLHEDHEKFTATDVPVALEMLVNQERLVWPYATSNKPRPGWLTQPASLPSDSEASNHPSSSEGVIGDSAYRGRTTESPISGGSESARITPNHPNHSEEIGTA